MQLVESTDVGPWLLRANYKIKSGFSTAWELKPLIPALFKNQVELQNLTIKLFIFKTVLRSQLVHKSKYTCLIYKPIWSTEFLTCSNFGTSNARQGSVKHQARNTSLPSSNLACRLLICDLCFKSLVTNIRSNLTHTQFLIIKFTIIHSTVTKLGRISV